MVRIKKIIEFVLDDIADFFPYFFIFYVISFIVSLIFESWVPFFNWQALHIGTFIFGLLSLLASKGKKNYIKVVTASIVLIYFLGQGLTIGDFFVLLYASFSIVFIIDSRISAIVALFLFSFCPVLLILKKENAAEIFAVYTYYLLVIAAITYLEEYIIKKHTNPLLMWQELKRHYNIFKNSVLMKRG